MKTRKTSPILMALSVVCALGAGIMGTLLWMENRPAPVAAPVSASAPASTDAALPAVPGVPAGVPLPATSGVASTNNATQGGSQEPPATLTSGMSPPEAALSLGNWYYDHENWARAIENYRVAIKSGVDNPNIRTDLGNSLRFSGQPQQALEQYQIAQKQDPTHEPSLFNQGALYAVSLQNPSKGVEAWRAYLKRFPDGGSAEQARKFIAQYAKAQ